MSGETIDKSEKFFKTSEACNLLNISERTLWRWIKKGKIKACKEKDEKGRDLLLIPEQEILRIKEEQSSQEEEKANEKPSPRDISALDILEELGIFDPSDRRTFVKGNGYLLVRCPFHEDSNPSFSVITSDGYKGRPAGFARCFGCGKVIRNHVHLIQELLKIPEYSDQVKKYVFLLKPYREKEFRIFDKNGNLLYIQEIWFDPKTGKKRAKYVHISGNGKRKAGIPEGVKPLPYGLHTVKKGRKEFILLESPQDADSILSLFPDSTVIATCGASNWHPHWREDVFLWMKEIGYTHVCIIPQNDSAGTQWAMRAYRECSTVFEEVAVSSVCEKEQVKDIAELIEKIDASSDDDARKVVQEKIRASLSLNLPPLWMIDPWKYTFDLKNKQIVQEKTTLVKGIPIPIYSTVFCFLIYPEVQLIDALKDDEVIGYVVSKENRNGKMTRYILEHTKSEYMREFKIDEKTAAKVSEFVCETAEKNAHILPKKKAIFRTGWKGNTFVSPVTTPQYEAIPPLDRLSTNEAISEETARENLKLLFSLLSEGLAALPVLFCLCVPYFPEGMGAFLEIVGETTAGKTFSAETAFRLSGYEGEISKWYGTANALIEKLVIYNHFPHFLDEIHKAKPEVVRDVVYTLTSGRQKERLTKSLKLRKAESFTTGIISTGEKSIVDIAEQTEDIYPGGLLTRTIYVPADSSEKVFGCPEDQAEEMKDLIRELRESLRGWLFKLWFKFFGKNAINIRKHGNTHVEGIFDGMVQVAEGLKELDLLYPDSHKKVLQTIQNLREVQAEIRRELRKKLDIREELEELLIANKHLFPDKDNFSRESKQAIWGWKENCDGKMFFYILPVMLKKEICPRLSVSYQVLKRVSREKGWLSKKSVRIDSIGSRKLYVYAVKNSS